MPKKNSELLLGGEAIRDSDRLVVVRWPAWWRENPLDEATYYVGRVERNKSVTLLVPIWRGGEEKCREYIDSPHKVREYIAGYRDRRPGPKAEPTTEQAEFEQAEFEPAPAKRQRRAIEKPGGIGSDLADAASAAIAASAGKGGDV